MFAKVAVPAPIYPLDETFSYKIPDNLIEHCLPGSLVGLLFGRQKTWGVVIDVHRDPQYNVRKTRPIDRLILKNTVFDKTHRDLFHWMSHHYAYPLGEVYNCALPASVSGGSVGQIEKDLTFLEKLGPAPQTTAPSPYKLTTEQNNALDTLKNGGPNLLWGVTGSGKTEVYLTLAERALAQDKTVLILVPEIALTPQLSQRFEQRFPKQIAIFHSSIKNTALRKNWLSVYSGQKRLVLGARSALFAPLKNIGLLVLDEEHDSSYKQDDRLRYHARASAMKLASLYHATLVLGSATPSLEAFHLTERDEMQLLKLQHRAQQSAELPTIELVDLKKQLTQKSSLPHMGQADEEFIGPPNPGSFYLSPPLKNALEQCLHKGEQSILFLNRRGLAGNLVCRSCGNMATCPSCDVGLTLHQNKKLLCHYCGFQKDSGDDHCTTCNSDNGFFKSSLGTQSIEEALQLEFPSARLLRLDQDTTEKRGSLENIVASFRDHEADILIGTQMVAKGHDFPKVSLVGILLGEMGLGVPDFRANERIFQLLLQVSGRAGRAQTSGRVIVQSFQPESSLFTALKNFRQLEDYEHYIRHEMLLRERHAYPPYGQLCLFRFDGLDLGMVFDAANMVKNALSKIQNAELMLMGPVEAPLFRIKNRYRYQLLLKSPNKKLLLNSAHWIVSRWHELKLERQTKTRMVADLDPQQLM